MLTPDNTTITDAELAELRRLHAAATPGTWDYDGMHNEITTPGGDLYWLIVSECRSAPDQAQKEQFGHGFDANFASIAALHNAFPALLARLEAAEREREELASVVKSPEYRQMLADQANLPARDAQQRRKRAAEVLRTMVLDGDNYREDCQAADLGTQALEAWAWVERNKAMVSWQNGAWHCAVGLCTHAINGTVLAAVLDAMAKEGKG